MRMEQLQYLVEIIDSHSMNQAAKKLFVTQPALSQSIVSLEEELGFELLKRSSKGIAPTVLGSIVYEDAKKLTDDFKSYQHKWKNFVQKTPSVPINIQIVATPFACRIISNDIIPKLWQENFNVFLTLREVISTPSFQSSMLQENINIGIQAFSEDNRQEIYSFAKEHELNLDILFEDTYQLFLSKQSPLAHKNKIVIADLANYNLAYLSASPESSEIINNFLKPKSCIGLNNAENIFKLIEQDKAFTFMASANRHYLNNDNICTRPIADFYYPICYYILYPNNDRLSNEERYLISYLKDFFRENIL